MLTTAEPAVRRSTFRSLRWLPLLALLTATLAAGQDEVRPLRTGGLSAETAALLVSGQQGGSIPLFALAVPGAAEPEARAPVEVFVEAPGEAILAGQREESLRLEICLYALSGSRVVDSSLETVLLDLARDRQQLLAGGVKSRSTLELPAGEYVVRILLRNAGTGELGLRSLALTVPGRDSATTLQVPLVPDPAGGWLRLARDPRAPSIGFWPAARPVLAADSDAELQVLVRALEPDSARLELSGAGDESLEVPAAVSSAAEAAPAGYERWLVQSRLPSLAPGDYELRLRVADTAVSPRLPIVVRPDGGGVWARAGGELPPPDLEPESPLPAVGDRRGSRRAAAALEQRLQVDYSAALGRLAAADLPGALSALTRLESDAFDREGGADAVANAEMEVARSLARNSEGSLVPLFDLHYRAYRRYLSSESFRLSSHARDQLLDLVALHLSRRPQDTTPATDVLVVMANQLQQAGLARYSRVIFRRALQVDPTHEGALLGIAAGLEKHGEYREASEFLQQLLDAQPGHREARLRMAINLARIEKPVESRRLLAELVEAEETDWVLSVAYHEVVRDLVHRERLEEAEELLVRAGERLPEDDQLRLLLAAVRDARLQAEGGASGPLPLRSRADRASPRHRYQQWPRFHPEASREADERRRQALAAALQGLGGAA